eukprot:6903034-Karenia_brevis.AAC.1
MLGGSAVQDGPMAPGNGMQNPINDGGLDSHTANASNNARSSMGKLPATPGEHDQLASKLEHI